MLALSHVPKTGGTTLVGILRRCFGMRHCDVEPIRGRKHTYTSSDHRFAARLHPPLVSIAGHQVTPASDLDAAVRDVLYVVVLRDPWTRVASQYQHVERHYAPPPVEEALEKPWWHDRQTRQLAGVPDVGEALRILEEKQVLVGFTETFDEFLVMLRERFVHPRLDVRYERRNVAPRNEVAKRVLADPRARARIEETNRLDLELYRRVREELYPRQRARFPDLDARVKRFLDENRPPNGGGRELLNRAWRNTVYKPALGLARLRS